MWRIYNGWLVKRDGIFEVLARFNATSYLSDVFVSKLEEAVSEVFQNSGEKRQHSKAFKVKGSKLSTCIAVHHCKEVHSCHPNSST